MATTSRTRIQDVAAAAGVSIKTVSRVMNDEPGVKAQTGARVVVVNAEPTPYDHLADLVVRERIGTSLPRLLAP